MPGMTSPDNLVYPIVGDSASPRVAITQLADSAQDALDRIHDLDNTRNVHFYGPAAEMSSTIDGVVAKLGDTYQETDGDKRLMIHDGVQFAPSFVLVTGPASQIQATTETQIVTASIVVAAGRRYRVTGQILGTQVTNAGTVNAAMRSDVIGTGSSGTLMTRPIANRLAAASTEFEGSASWVYTATTTGVVTFSLTFQSTAAAARVAANSCQLSIEPVST
jgi:hypothetical protein